MPIDAYLAMASALVASLLAIGVLLRARPAIAPVVFSAGMLVLAAESVFAGLIAAAAMADAEVFWLRCRLSAMSLLPGIWLLFSLTYARGNYRQFLTHWRAALIIAFLAPPAIALFGHGELAKLASHGLAGEYTTLDFGTAGMALFVFALLGFVGSLMQLERTLRTSVGMTRWRIKFMILGLGLLFCVRIYTSSQSLLFGESNPARITLNSTAMLLAAPLILRALFRAGQFEGQVYPSRTAIHHSITLLSASGYLLIVGVLAEAADYLGGSGSFELKAFIILVSLVTLAVLAQSDRIRHRVRNLVSQHFQRPHHDYANAWRRLTEATTSHFDPRELGRTIVKLVANLFESLSVALWLVDERHGTLVLVGSTSLTEAQASSLAPTAAETGAIVRAIQQSSAPLRFEAPEEPWAAALRRCHPSAFPDSGQRLCLPLKRQTEVVGVLLLGDRVGHADFSAEDIDLLECVCHHATATLLNVQFSEKLLQSREFTAFQTMATFLVHDLKNAGSTLNLMLANLPDHWNDPEFRQDATRAIGNTVAHINQLVSRLGALRHELQLQPVATNLDALLTAALAPWQHDPGVSIESGFAAIPPLTLDPDQITKVVTNLVLNAREAIIARSGPKGASSGHIRIATSLENKWAVITVADNGCGMPREFLDRDLFRPFRTTKKGGIGIGMFQTRMIVEAHGGRITAESQPGKGTTFRVFLPLSKPLATVPVAADS